MLQEFTLLGTVKELKAEGYKLAESLKISGIYVVVYKGFDEPRFLLPEGTGGYFKGKNPNVIKEDLIEKWVNFKSSDDKILYIGSGEDIRTRIKAFIKFGSGKSVAHRGGRYVWQLADSDDLEIYWREVDNSVEEERLMLEEFKKDHDGKLPFANLINQ
ncbi:MAG: GIY-YIG nuclease family protein [Candidatus Falkowbacteria bacterium]